MLKDTIISAFNYDGTLLKWLKKVEDALQNASASEFRVNKKGNATISFSIVFANGDTLESGDIILQQGESVTGATIRQGHLILTLSNGNELDAGDLGAVTGFSINASQHLIVTYQNGTTQDLGAIFTGNVNINGNLTANSIIENMQGYTFSQGTATGYERTYSYAGVCKNGNKITFAVCLTITKTDENAIRNFDLGIFTIPSSVGEKLVDVNVGTYAWLDNKVISIFENSITFVNIPVRASKVADRNDLVVLQVGDSVNMGVNKAYVLRYEVTFLLSNNLAS